MMLLIDGLPDGMTRRPDGWKGTRFSNFANCAESFGSTLNGEIPIKKHLYIEVILSNNKWPITN
jgi:hypothetical protein